MPARVAEGWPELTPKAPKDVDGDGVGVGDGDGDGAGGELAVPAEGARGELAVGAGSSVHPVRTMVRPTATATALLAHRRGVADRTGEGEVLFTGAGP
ncbi:hypothetical protein [Cellulomonas marina]|uniref:hypothetical protein n=1 Tax=Cellulomonas marina TaxID=988821 RepID=UPI0015872EF3|nr:hypothetical protein [Cellulomonas marina]